MKVLILNLLISYILCIYSSNSTISRKLFNLTIHGTIGYNGNTPSLTILDLSGCKDDVIYITYKINRRDFNTDIIYYEFTDVYPNEYFECANQMKSSHSSTSSSGSKHFKTYTFKLSFEFGKQNKRAISCHRKERLQASVAHSGFGNSATFERRRKHHRQGPNRHW